MICDCHREKILAALHESCCLISCSGMQPFPRVEGQDKLWGELGMVLFGQACTWLAGSAMSSNFVNHMASQATQLIRTNSPTPDLSSNPVE